jgi:hypothetical protein
MIGSTEIQLDTEARAERPPESRGEDGTSIGCDVSRNSVKAEYKLNILARCSEVNPSSLNGRKWDIFVRRHTITVMESYFSESGSLTIASIEMDLHGPLGIGSGWSNPTGGWCGVLFTLEAALD